MQKGISDSGLIFMQFKHIFFSNIKCNNYAFAVHYIIKAWGKHNIDMDQTF